MTDPTGGWCAPPPAHVSGPAGTWIEPRRRPGWRPSGTGGGSCRLPENGRPGELWRCGCGRLYRRAMACDLCDQYGKVHPHLGQHAVGQTWRDATLWQRIRYRRQGRT